VKIATWNVNSIRVREARALAFLERHAPDVVCIQETKVVDAAFPRAPYEAAGWHVECHGQKTYNGVAVLTRAAPEHVGRGIPDGVEDGQARVLHVRVGGIDVIDVYVPNGTEVGSDKFAFKLAWLGRLRAWLDRDFDPAAPLVVCGDFNIAPEERDVHDPEAYRGQIHFHPDEHRALAHLKDWGLTDSFRLHHEEDGRYTWWDFRGGMFWKNKGLRIDYHLISAPLVPRCTGVEIDTWERKGKQPSDHAPVLATFAD